MDMRYTGTDRSILQNITGGAETVYNLAFFPCQVSRR